MAVLRLITSIFHQEHTLDAPSHPPPPSRSSSEKKASMSVMRRITSIFHQEHTVDVPSHPSYPNHLSSEKKAVCVTASQPEPAFKEPPFYSAHLEELSGPVRKLLEGYSGIKPERIDSHVEALRDKACEIFPYPRLDAFLFLDLHLPTSPLYPTLVSRLTHGATFIDLGCGLGQELRQLALDGVPFANLYGADLTGEFWELGLDLFADRGRLQATFVEGDLCDPASPLGGLDGTVDVVHAAMFFHLWGYEKQVRAMKRAVRLLRPVRGSVIVGRQLGSVRPGPVVHLGEGLGIYRHDERTFKEIWERVGWETGVELEVSVELERRDSGYFDAMEELGEEEAGTTGTRRLTFVVTRV